VSKLSTVAWIGHNLGLGAAFGGQLFGKYALNSKLSVIDSRPDRGKVLNAAWNSYNVINAASLGTAVATWLAGRTAISGRSIDDEARKLVLAKDALLAGSTLVGLAAMVCGKKLTAQAPGGAVPVESGTKPALETPEEAAKLLRTVNALGNTSIALIGATVAVTTILSMKSGESTEWSAVSRLLP
jgi:hypothetical protein